MNKPRPFRFGVSVHESKSRAEWRDIARQAEAFGYSKLFLPDHLGDQLSPIPALVGAADATSMLRVGSLVFDNDLRHPVMLAKEAATLAVLSGAAREADVIGFIPRARPDGQGQDLMEATPEALEQKITWLREAAGARFADLELGILVAQVFTMEDREQAAHLIATTLAAGYHVSTDQLLQAPYLLIGSIDQICEDLQVRR
jgi:Luciferase-like monooxygenase